MNAHQRPALLEHGDVKHLTDQEWLERLLRSIDQPTQDNRIYPGFPNEHVQKAFVGSAYADAVVEGYRFYKYLRDHFSNRRFEVQSNRYLDFGCGWGRISRLFLHDFERGDMAGVDVDQEMISFCQEANVPGGYFSITNDAPLPFADNSFRLVTAYSVFTHLPGELFRQWLTELLRVTAPGGLIAFTVEPERFLDFVAAIDPAAPPSGWHAALFAELGDVEARRRELHVQGFTYLPTGGGPYRPPQTYGDMVVTRDFVSRCASALGEVVAFVDDPDSFWQALVVVRRHRWRLPFRGALGL